MSTLREVGRLFVRTVRLFAFDPVGFVRVMVGGDDSQRRYDDLARRYEERDR